MPLAMVSEKEENCYISISKSGRKYPDFSRGQWTGHEKEELEELIDSLFDKED